MDRTKTVFGRYRPWTIAGVPLIVYGLCKLLIPPAHVTTGYLVVNLLITYAGSSMITLGISAWLTLLSKTYHDRSRVFAISNIVALLGLVSILLLPWFTHGRIAAGVKGSMPTLGVILAVAFPIALVVTLFTPEKLGAETVRPTYRIADYASAWPAPPWPG